jgi:predicted N-acyltransferase
MYTYLHKKKRKKKKEMKEERAMVIDNGRQIMNIKRK